MNCICYNIYSNVPTRHQYVEMESFYDDAVLCGDVICVLLVLVEGINGL